MEKYVRKIRLPQWNYCAKFSTLLFFVGVFTILGNDVVGQNYQTITSGLAGDASTWQNGDIPDFFGGPRGGDATVLASDTIWYTGNIEIRGEIFTISSGSAVIIYGDILIKNRGVLEINGLLICSGELKTAGGSVVSGSGGELYYGSLGGGTRIPGTVEHTTTEKTWKGTGNEDWSTANNWEPSGVPSQEAIVISPVAAYMPVLSGFSTLSTIRIPGGNSSLTISSMGFLTLTETLENEGTLVIQSGPNGTGSIITPNATGSGTLHMECYIPDNLPGDDWHIISSPVHGIKLTDFASNNEVNATSTDYDLAPYNEGAGDWNPYTLLNSNTEFEVGKGYSMRRKLDPDIDYVEFTGETSDFTTGDFGPVAITNTRNGWNALGNPYISSINVETFLSTNSSALYDEPFNVAYLWDPTVSDYVGVGTGHIASGQGFLVKSQTGGGNVSFSTAMQEHSSAVLKSGEIPCPTIHLWAKTKKLQNKTTLKFSPNMTDGLDPNYDIGKLKGNPDIAIYTRMSGSFDYDLQDQVLPEIGTETKTIPVGLDFIPGGELTFSIETIKIPENVQITLEDKETGTNTLLSATDAAYTAYVAAENSGIGRFNLIISKQIQTGIEIATEKPFNVYTKGKIVYVNGPASTDTQIELFSIDGRCWYKSFAQNQNINQIDGSGFPSGVYILRLNQLGKIQSTKFVLTEN